MSGVGADLRWAIRYAAVHPVWAASIGVTLALAIGVAETAGGLARAVLWRALPFRAESELVLVWERAADPGASPAPFRVTGARFAQWRDRSSAFESMALFGAASFPLETDAGVRILRGGRVSAQYFHTLGIAPLAGRAFITADERPGAERVVVLSEPFWRAAFAARTEAIGTLVTLGGDSYRIVGVMPRAPYPGWPVNPADITVDPDMQQLWVPIQSPSPIDQNARSHVFGVVARLRPHVTIEQASAQLTALGPAGNDRHGAAVGPLRGQVVRSARLPLLVLFGAAIAVFLVACANVAALQVGAFERRREELTTRLAVGAGSLRVARQLVVEALVITLPAGAAGLALARLALTRLPARLPVAVPLVTEPSVDARVALAAFVAAGVAAVGMCAWPIVRLRLTGAGLRPVRARAHGNVYRTLIVTQVAFAVALISASALLVRSLENVRAQPAGFSIDGVLTADVQLPVDRFRTANATAEAERRLLDSIRAVHGVSAAAVAYDQPLEANWIDAFTLSGTAADERSAERQAQLRIVSPEYFDVMRVRVLSGRTFTADADAGSPGVVVVNQSFERAYGRAAGRRVRSAAAAATWKSGVPSEYEIIGVVADERFRGLEQPGEPAVYVSSAQFPLTDPVVLVRTNGDPSAIASDVRAAVHRAEPRAAFEHPAALSEILARQLAPRTITAGTVTAFSSAALALAIVGLYGLLSMIVASRRHEIGIRLTLGASPRIVARAIVFESAAVTAAGTAVGCLLALVAGRALQGWLFGVDARNLPLIAAVTSALLAVSVLAAVVPARRAAAIDPASSLRGS